MMRKSFGVLAVVLLVLWAPRVFAQNEHLIGRKVMTIKWGTEARAGNTVIHKLELAEVLKVTKVNGDWLWFNDAVGGWVRRSDVVPYEQAIDHFNRLVQEQPSARNYRNRAEAWIAKGEREIAIGDLNEAIRRNPGESAYYSSRGTTWKEKGELDKAIADYSEAIRLAPDTAYLYFNRGNTLGRKGELDKAVTDFNEAIRLDPMHYEAYISRAYAWGVKKEYRKAVADFDEAIRLRPKSNLCYGGLAFLLATCPDENFRDGKRAVELATKACELTGWNDDSDLENLSAAYAAAGDIEQAKSWLEKAIDMNPHTGEFQTKMRKKMLAAYEAGKPFIYLPGEE